MGGESQVVELLTNGMFYVHLTIVLLLSGTLIWFLFQLHDLKNPVNKRRRKWAWLIGAVTASVLNFGLPTYWSL